MTKEALHVKYQHMLSSNPYSAADGGSEWRKPCLINVKHCWLQLQLCRADSIILEVMDLIKGWRSCAVTTLGRDGSDLTATTIGKARWQELDHVVEELEKIVVVNLFRTDQ